MSKIFLKKNWSEPFVFGDETPAIFVGRRDELESLKFTLVNNDSGTILVSAVRGIGKTSFVHKALGEIKGGTITPIFVNAGHVISSLQDRELPKKELLASLIRSAHFEFPHDLKLEQLYYNSIGKHKTHTQQKSTSGVEDSSELALEIKLVPRSIAILIATILATTGIVSNHLIMKIVGVSALIVLILSFGWRRKWTQSIKEKTRSETFIDDSIDYLENKFEKWLAENKKKRLVFIIDELDKVDEEKALRLIKEYKNLFSRSSAQFIFIAGPDAYDKIQFDREATAQAGGIFPTLFTQTFYLPLPNTHDLKEFLDKIFNFSDVDKSETQDVEDLRNYLLLHSKNDFFELKKLIGDLIFVEDGDAFLDTSAIKDFNRSVYSRSGKVYNYISLFCEKYYKRPKKYWKENSDFQKEIFEFIIPKLNGNFNFLPDEQSAGLRTFVNYLQRLGVIELKSVETERGERQLFRWTGKYKPIESADQLFEEDKNFIDSFNQLIKVANDIDDLPECFREGKFTRTTTVVKGRDGEKFSGVNLSETHKNYSSLNKKLARPTSRMEVLVEDVKEANKIIQEQIQEVLSRTFKIFVNILIEIIHSIGDDYYTNQTIRKKPEALNGCPSLKNALNDIEHKLFGRNDGSRELVVLDDFRDFGNFEESLNDLVEQRAVLVLNIITSTNEIDRNPTIRVEYLDKIGRKRRKKIKVNNFINVATKDNLRKLADPLRVAVDHLKVPID